MKQSLINFIVRQVSGPVVKYVSAAVRFGILWTVAQLAKLDPTIAAHVDATQVIGWVWAVLEIVIHQIAVKAHMDQATDGRIQSYLKQNFPVIPVARATPVKP